ncbi:hypothetical protein C8R42DRAFT_648836 [Lentinula raphanica]|nr:hypothetical protein C8R42DRAFT_648836 [Lentinula raphanica]
MQSVSGITLELGKYGITVNAYAPGFTKTSLIHTDELSDESFWNDPDSLARKYGIAVPPYFKMGQPEYIASLVSYLASEEAHYITGQTISPNGVIPTRNKARELVQGNGLASVLPFRRFSRLAWFYLSLRLLTHKFPLIDGDLTRAQNLRLAEPKSAVWLWFSPTGSDQYFELLLVLGLLRANGTAVTTKSDWKERRKTNNEHEENDNKKGVEFGRKLLDCSMD